MRYTIPKFNFEMLDKKLSRISRKCAELGCAFTYEIIGPSYIERRDKNGEMHRIEAVEINVDGTAVINGWSFVAEIEHHLDGNIVRCYGKADESWFSLKPNCDHCHTHKQRKHTYIIRNEAGEFKQVGKSCLLLYTCGLSADMAACYASAIKEAEEAMEFDFDSLSTDEYGYSMETFCKYAIATIKCCGYVKGDFIHDFTATRYRDEQASHEEIEEFIGWATSYAPMSDYERNAVNAVKSDCVILMRHGRLVGSFIAKWLRERAKASKAESNWLGNVGDKVTFVISTSDQARILYFKSFTKGHRTFSSAVWKFVDDSGNIVIYSGDFDFNVYSLDKAKLAITATVKELSTYKGEKQTVIQRPKESFIE